MKKYLKMWLVLVVAVLFLTVYIVRAATIGIDSFSETTIGLDLSSAGNPSGPLVEFADGDALAGVLGGERDITVQRVGGTAGAGQSVTLNVDTSATNQVLTISSQPNTIGKFTITWDGNDNNAAFGTHSNLLATDLTAGGNDNLALQVSADQTGWKITIDIHNVGDTSSSTYFFTENQSISKVGRVYLIPFTAFADPTIFADLGAIVVTIDGVDDLDMTLSFFDAVDMSSGGLVDFGDLSESGTFNYGNVTLANNGAGHYTPGLTTQLRDPLSGTAAFVDTEADGQPDTDAGRLGGGDVDDENGVIATGNWDDGTGNIDVFVDGADGCLSAWLDWNSGFYIIAPNGSFNNLLENIVDNAPVTSGKNSFEFSIAPQTAAPVPLNARFRLVPDVNGNGDCSDQDPLYPTGIAIDGEIEDHQFRFNPTAVSLQNVSANSTSTVPVVGFIAFALLAIIGTGVAMTRRQRA